MISSSLPVLPKAFQTFFKRRISRSQVTYGPALAGDSGRRYENSLSKYSRGPVSNGSVSRPWDATDSPDSQFHKTYIPLKDVEISKGRSTKVTGGQAYSQGWGMGDSLDVERFPPPDAIVKTVHLESRHN